MSEIQNMDIIFKWDELWDTYFGEKTLQTNKWFLISSNTIV